VTALTLVLMLALGSLFLSRSSAYEPAVYSLLFGEVLGISANQLGPTIGLAAACILAIGVLARPLMLSSTLPDVAEARGIGRQAIETCFLLVLALATTMTVPVVGTLLIFSLMIGPPAAARVLVDRPLAAMGISAAFALAIVWSAIALSYLTNYPVGFFVGTMSAATYAAGRLHAAFRERRLSRVLLAGLGRA
jgi:zinc/manganese transport system permease protein